MTMLRTWSFGSDLGAQRAARALTGRPRESVGVEDVAVVSWPADRRRPLAWQACDVVNEGRLSGAFWGLLFAQLFLLPLGCRLPPSRDPASLDDTLAYLGLDERFVRTVRERVAPGTSALFVLGSCHPATFLLDECPAPLTAVLDDAQTARLHAAFDDDDE